MPQKLIIDADPGIGDALAIALAILDPEIDLLAVTATAGMVPGPDATRNVQAVVEALDPPKLPRIGGSDVIIEAVSREWRAATVTSREMNGANGLANWDVRVADLHNRHESFKIMTDLVRTYPQAITLLTLGPLNNVALAMERQPDFLQQLRGLVCLGGSVEVGGDVTAVAEFNIYANPEAARSILRSPATKTLVPLDVSRKVVLTFELFNRLPSDDGSPIGNLLGKLIPFALRASHQHLGVEGFRLHEVVALAALTQPHLFDNRPMAVDVETAGDLTRGMTVFDRRGIQQWQTNIEVVREVDGQGVLDYLTRVVKAAANPR